MSQTLPIFAEHEADGITEVPRPSPARRVLFISYVFPPVGGAGVQRTAKFVKYLPTQGWRPSVLTVQNPSVPAFDASLLADIPQDVLIRKARTLEPSYAVKNSVSAGDAKGNPARGRKAGGLKGAIKSTVRGTVKLVLQPDPQVLWAPAALREGAAFLREHRPDVILVSGPPFSSFLIGARLARRTGIPLVLDYRDEWDISNAYLENKRLDPASLWLQRRMQHYAVRSAAALVATTQSSAAALTKIRDICRSKASVHCIYNGYDPKDFPPANATGGVANSSGGSGMEYSLQAVLDVQPKGCTPCRGGASEKFAATAARKVSRERFRLAYVGTLWNLTSIEPLVKAMELVAQRSPVLAGKLELVVVGRRTEPQQQLLSRLKNLPSTLVEHPYLPHDEALQLVRDADGLCVLLSDVAGAERVVPAKLFEYMAAQRAIFCIAPKGEMWDLLAAHPAAHCHEPRDVEAIAKSIEENVAAFCADGSAGPCEFDAIEHSRPHEAGQLARLLESLVRERDGRGGHNK